MGGSQWKDLCCPKAGNKVNLSLRLNGSEERRKEIEDMFVMNFGAVSRDPQNGDWSFIVPKTRLWSSCREHNF